MPAAGSEIDQLLRDPVALAGQDELTGPDGPPRRVQLRADADLLYAAAARLRHTATQDAYRGLHHPDRAYSLASILDQVALRWIYQDPALRSAWRIVARTLLGQDPAAGPGRPADGPGTE